MFPIKLLILSGILLLFPLTYSRVEAVRDKPVHGGDQEPSPRPSRRLRLGSPGQGGQKNACFMNTYSQVQKFGITIENAITFLKMNQFD
jgi:hypothetical protein